MNIAKVVILLVLGFGLVACGGGGGGSSDPQPVSTQPPAPTPTPTPTPTPAPSPNPGTPPPSSNQNGSATIFFPWPKSIARNPQITVSGIANDPDGIADIRINGQSATLTSLAVKGNVGSTGNTILANSPNEAWSTTIDLIPGQNQVVVEIEDNDGNIETNIDSAEIEYSHVPIHFGLDSGMNRIIGESTVFNPSFARLLVSYDYVNDSQIIHNDALDSSSAKCFKNDSEDYLHLKFAPGNIISLHSYNLQTGVDSNLKSHTLDPASEGFANSVSFRGMVCASGSQSVYVLINYSDSTTFQTAKSIIFEFSLDTLNFSILSESDLGVSPTWIAGGMALASDKLIAHSVFGTPAPLVEVNIADGSRTNIPSNSNINVAKLALDDVNDIIYVVNYDGVFELETASGDFINRSVVMNDDPFVFSQIQSAAYDPANNRIIVGDSDLDALIGVDLGTGTRSDFLSRKIGTGVRMIAPRNFALTSDMSKAYVGDDGGNAPEKLFEVDLATGDRVVIGDINQVFNNHLSGLAFDEGNNKIFVSFLDVILEVDLTTEKVTEIASSTKGTGVLLQALSDILLDSDNNRLLIADAGLEAIIALDLTSNVRTVVSQAGNIGSGEPFSNVNSLTFSEDNSTLYASNQMSGNIMSVDMTSGDRSVFLDTCLDNGSNNLLGAQQTLQQILYDSDANNLLILGDSLLQYDFDTSQCDILQSFLGAGRPSNLQLTPENQLMGISFKNFGQYDPESNDYVIISK